jgi:hypothetical protein
MYSPSITLTLILFVYDLLQIGKIILQTYVFVFVLFYLQFIYMKCQNAENCSVRLT